MGLNADSVMKVEKGSWNVKSEDGRMLAMSAASYDAIAATSVFTCFPALALTT